MPPQPLHLLNNPCLLLNLPFQLLHRPLQQNNLFLLAIDLLHDVLLAGDVLLHLAQLVDFDVVVGLLSHLLELGFHSGDFGE